MPENQLPRLEILLLPVDFSMSQRTSAPDNRRMTVKLDASMASLPSASRHNTELAANAISARPVNTRVLKEVWPGKEDNEYSAGDRHGVTDGVTVQHQCSIGK